MPRLLQHPEARSAPRFRTANRSARSARDVKPGRYCDARSDVWSELQHLVHLPAIRALQRERRYSLAAIRSQLAPLGAAELERLAVTVLPELAAPVAPSAPVAPVAPPAPVASHAWHRLTLLPGLEIHLHAAASGELRALARSIVASVQGGVVSV